MTTENFNEKFQALERKLDRILNELEFVKHRTATYLGGNTGLTYLIDETPIYINTNDFGCPANFINGGKYEEEYITILSSFRKPDSVFLDIGANLGVFSLRLAPMLRQGQIFAFEPNPKINALFARSSFLGGFDSFLKISSFGVSDRDGEVSFSVPQDHAGGGFVASGEDNRDASHFTVQVKRLDDWFPSHTHVDIVKIDVEGHELHALRGMTKILDRSKDAVVLFEKLGVQSGIEDDLATLFESLGMKVYFAEGTSLVAVDRSALRSRSGYFLAARPQTVGDELKRDFFKVYALDLQLRHGSIQDDKYHLDASVPSGDVLFYGPYWYLPRGTYRVDFIGQMKGEISLSIAERFGYPVEEITFTEQRLSANVAIHRDLTKFELVGRSKGGHCSLALKHLTLTRIG